MDKNEKAQRRRGVAKGYHSQQSNFATKRPNTQPPIAPGTALSAFLKRYKRDLLQLKRTREVSRIIDHVDQLLILAEGGNHDNG